MKRKIAILTLTVFFFFSSVTLISGNVVQAASTPSYKYVVNIPTLNVREKASYSGKIVGIVKNGVNLQVLKVTNKDWLQISFKGKDGYVFKKYVKKIPYVTSVSSTVDMKNAPNEWTFSAQAVGGSGVLYQFAIQQGTSPFTVVQSYSNNASYLWRPTTEGKYKVRVYAKSTGTTDKEAVYHDYTYVISNLQLLNSVDGAITTTDNKYYTIQATSNVELAKYQIQILEGQTWVKKLDYIDNTNTYVWRPIKNGDYTIRIYGRYVKSTQPFDVMKEIKVTITGVEDFQTVDLRKPSNVTSQEINSYIDSYVQKVNKASVLTNQGQTIIDVANMYEINAQFLAALMIHESAFGTSYLAHFKKNLTGLAAFDSEPYDSAVRFSTVKESIAYAAQFVRGRYLNDGAAYNDGAFLGFRDVTNAANSKGMNANYATDADWGKLIAQHMQNIKPYDPNYYDKQTITSYLLIVDTRPNLSDTYPDFSLAMANAPIDLYSTKPSVGQTPIAQLKIGQIFTPVQKTNDFYLQIKVNNTLYWTKNLPFYNYMKYFQFTNVLRVTNRQLTDVPIYDTPNGNIVGTVPNFMYIQASLTNQNQLETQNGFNAILINGKKVWIVSSKVASVFPKQ